MAKRGLASAWKVIPALKSRNIEATVNFYIEQLHFDLGGTHADADHGPPTFASVFKGDKAVVNLYHFLCDGDNFVPGWVMIALGTAQIDEYYEALVREGSVNIVEPVEDKPWGYRQFSIKDQDGNKLTFFRFLEGGNPGTDDGGDLSAVLTSTDER